METNNQTKRDFVSQLLSAHGWTATLDLFTLHTVTAGAIKLMGNDPTALELLSNLATVSEEMNFQRRMKYISIDGRPPILKSRSKTHGTHANDTPEPTPTELLEILHEITAANAAARKRQARPRPHAQSRQTELFEE